MFYYIVKSVLEHENFQDVAGNVAYGYQNENSARHEVSSRFYLIKIGKGENDPNWHGNKNKRAANILLLFSTRWYLQLTKMCWLCPRTNAIYAAQTNEKCAKSYGRDPLGCTGESSISFQFQNFPKSSFSLFLLSPCTNTKTNTRIHTKQIQIFSLFLLVQILKKI